MLAATPKLMFSNGAGETTVRELRSIYDLLDVVRPRPGMYIGDNSILALRSFLSGFDVGLLSLDAWLAEGEPPFGDFHDWVAARNGLRESTLGWANILLRATGREDTALIRFFEELDEFRRDRIKVLRSADAPPGAVARWSTGGVHHEARVEGFELEGYGRSPVVYLVELRPDGRHRSRFFRSSDEAAREAEQNHRVHAHSWREVTTE